MSTTENKRIAQNTLFLYFRMILIVAINLFAVRVILKVLGVEDYGIYNVVGGIVTLFSFLSGSLSSGAQRFLAYEIGRKDYDRLRHVFSMTTVVFGGIACILFVLVETLGLWFLNYKMNIPAERMEAANLVFQFSVFTFMANIMTIPYNAAIIAWERMVFFAYISIIEAVSKLLCVFILLWFACDKLILYAGTIFLVAIFLFLIYWQYGKRRLIGCSFQWNWDSALCKSLLTYSGWNMLGTVALILRNQGINIVLNLFFSTVVNAAHTIGQQVNGFISQFINNIYMATRPQITKLYAEGKMDEMWKLVFSSARLAYYLLLVLCLPVLLCIDDMLQLWLGVVPSYTPTIIKCLLIVLLIETSVNQIIAVFQAANKLRKYQSTSTVVLLLNVPLSYICLEYIPNVYAPYIISIGLSVVYVLVLLRIAKAELLLDIKYYVKEILLRIMSVTLLSAIIPISFLFALSEFAVNFIFTALISISSSLSAVWMLGLSLDERKQIKGILYTKIKHN
ncbi:MAG: lipopolysaccharide biosynthesis protein [Bacteroides sp.]|nr:lipopolysaccharide biosynthesis protein [Bacteroides sp.]